MRSLAEALRFLSIIPVPGRPPEKNSFVLAVYPLAGAILGIIAAVAAWAFGYVFSPAGVAVVAVAIRIAISGGLHMDGLADLADGMGGGQNREKRLAIMSDSRLGSFGALALIVMVALQIAVIAELFVDSASLKPMQSLYPLIFAPALSRGIIPLMMKVFPSARPGGMGDRNRISASTAVVITSLVSVLFIAVFFYGITGIVLAAGVTLLVLSGSARISKQLGGLTGDIYGALIETADLLTLFGILLLYRFNLSTPGLVSLVT